MAEQILLAVDGSNLFNRAWYTLKSPGPDTLRERVGKMLEGLVRRHEARHLIVALDSPCTFRRDEIPSYKAERVKRSGPGERRNFRRGSGRRSRRGAWTRASRKEGHEADDVLAAVVDAVARAGSPCAIWLVSRDTDLLQLIDDRTGVRVVWPDGAGAGEQVLDEAAATASLAAHRDFAAPIHPRHLPDLRAIAGGKDDLPRIEVREGKPPYGFTTKRAADLLAQGATLDTLAPSGAHSWLLTPREAAWMRAGHAAAIARREALRLRAECPVRKCFGRSATSTLRLGASMEPAA